MLFPIFVVVTLAEIYVLVSVGQAIGGLSTVLLSSLLRLLAQAFLGSRAGPPWQKPSKAWQWAEPQQWKC